MADSFVLYTNYIDQIELLDDAQRGRLLTAIFAHAAGQDIPELDGITSMCYSFIASQMDRDKQKYDETVEKRRKAGRKGGQAKASNTVEEEAMPNNAKQSQAKEANASFAKHNDNVNDNDNDNVNDNDNDNDNVNDNDNDNVNDNAYANTEKVANATKERVPYQDVVEDFNDICKTLPRVTKLTDARRKVIKARFKDHGLAGIQTVFEKAESSDFLSGRNGGWSASFDWLMKPSNFQKVIEGNYDNKVKSKVKNIFDQIMEA